MLTLYNTLTRQKEIFKPIEDGKIKMYVCGPTVYDVPHIGHARSAYIFDCFRRYFKFKGYEVYFVRNVTDVDDKIITRARTELEREKVPITAETLKEKSQRLAAYYLEAYHHEMDILGIEPPTKEPLATDNIPQMIEFIRVLIEKGFAYVRDGDVYFGVEKFISYGKLSGQKQDQMMHGIRIEPDEKKNYPLDFTLWKAAKLDEPFWTSPWGHGRPGWHIECSVMSTSILGSPFDIHGGGLDLVFPHHENEIAQSEAALAKPFANYWLHNGLVTTNGEKMSKSLGNFVLVSDFLKEYNDIDLLKMLFLASHYSSSMDYNNEKINEAKHAKERITIFLDKVDKVLCMARGVEESEVRSQKSEVRSQKAEVRSQKSEVRRQKAEGRSQIMELENSFYEAMDDDLNTPAAISVIFECVKRGNDHLSSTTHTSDEKVCALSEYKNLILKFAEILGLSFKTVEYSEKEKDRIDKLVDQREEARKKKDYKKADKIRKDLMSEGIVIEDTPEGPVWRKG